MNKERKFLTGLVLGGLIQSGCMAERAQPYSPLVSPLAGEPTTSGQVASGNEQVLRLPLIFGQLRSTAGSSAEPLESPLPSPTPALVTNDSELSPTQLYQPEPEFDWREYVNWARDRLVRFWELSTPQRNLLRESVEVLFEECEDIRERTIGFRIVDSFDNGEEVDMLAWALQADSCEEQGRRWDVAESAVQAFRRCEDSHDEVRSLISESMEEGISHQERNLLVERINLVTPESGCVVK